MGFFSQFFHKKQVVADFDLMVSNNKIEMYSNEDYRHWNKRACSTYLKWARNMFLSKPRENEQYLFNLKGIEYYLQAAVYAASINDGDKVKQILLELSTKRVLIEDTIYYDNFSDMMPEEGYWETYQDYIRNFQNFEGVDYIMFLKDWDLHTRRLHYSYPIHKPVQPRKEVGESSEYFAFRESKFKREKAYWDKLKESPMPSFPKISENCSLTQKNKINDNYKKSLSVWEEAQEDKKQEERERKEKKKSDWEWKVAKFKREISKSKGMILGKMHDILEDYKINAIIISEIDVLQYGRLKGAFGEYGYSLTNPVCVKEFVPLGLSVYMSTIEYERKRVRRYECIAIYEVSIFPNLIIKKMELEFDGISKKVYLYFSENPDVTGIDTPQGITEYSNSVSKDNHIRNECIRYSLKEGFFFDYYEKLALVKHENSITRKYTSKLIWKKS